MLGDGQLESSLEERDLGVLVNKLNTRQQDYHMTKSVIQMLLEL